MVIKTNEKQKYRKHQWPAQSLKLVWRQVPEITSFNQPLYKHGYSHGTLCMIKILDMKAIIPHACMLLILGCETQRHFARDTPDVVTLVERRQGRATDTEGEITKVIVKFFYRMGENC